MVSSVAVNKHRALSIWRVHAIKGVLCSRSEISIMFQFDGSSEEPDYLKKILSLGV